MGSTQFPASYGQTAGNATADPSAVSRLTSRALIESCLEWAVAANHELLPLYGDLRKPDKGGLVGGLAMTLDV